MEDAQGKGQQKRKDLRVFKHGVGPSPWPTGAPIVPYWKAEGFIPVGAGLHKGKPRRSLIHRESVLR